MLNILGEKSERSHRGSSCRMTGKQGKGGRSWTWLWVQGLVFTAGLWGMETSGRKACVPFPRKCTEQEDRGTLFDARMRSEKGGAASQPAPKKSSCIALSPAPRHHHNARTKSPIIPSQHGICNPIEGSKIGPAAPRRILSSCPMNKS